MCEYQSVECAFTSPVSIESGMLVRSVFLVHGLNKISFFRLYTQMQFWASLFSLGSSCEVGYLFPRSSRLVIMSGITAGTRSQWSMWRPVGSGAMLL